MMRALHMTDAEHDALVNILRQYLGLETPKEDPETERKARELLRQLVPGDGKGPDAVP